MKAPIFSRAGNCVSVRATLPGHTTAGHPNDGQTATECWNAERDAATCFDSVFFSSSRVAFWSIHQDQALPAMKLS